MEEEEEDGEREGEEDAGEEPAAGDKEATEDDPSGEPLHSIHTASHASVRCSAASESPATLLASCAPDGLRPMLLLKCF